MKKTIIKLNNIGKDYIDDTFKLIQKSNLFIIDGKNISKALNQKKNDNKIVNVLNWFDDYWLYIEIKFIPKSKKRSFPNTFFTLSVFKGMIDDEIKEQLFRAEWDNYENQSDKHPQPHWHIYTNNEKEELQKSVEEAIAQTDDNFIDFMEAKNDFTDLSKFHFAMNGQWSNKNTDIHKIVKETDLTNWFSGVLNHLKNELKYLNEQKRKR